MLKLTFKNVDQGDSIILEWTKGSVYKVGVIDCKKAFRTNPVLDYIKSQNLKKIDFLLLSHPHLDHLSGFNELLRYCIDQKIQISYFFHTSNNTISFWKAAVTSGEAKNTVTTLFKTIREESEVLGMIYLVVQGDVPYQHIDL